MAVGAQNDLGGQQRNLNGFSVQMKVFSKKKKKKKRSSPKLRQYFGNGVPKYPDYLPKNRPFARVFDDFRRFELPPRLLRLCSRGSVLGLGFFCLLDLVSSTPPLIDIFPFFFQNWKKGRTHTFGINAT